MATKTSAEVQFVDELEVFRKDTEQSIQFFYGNLAVNAAAAGDKRILRLLNRAPLFWNTVVGALQTSCFISLGRVFDRKSPHNVDRLLRIAQKNPGIFSKAALADRKRSTSENADEWLDEYLKTAYVPKPDDFNRLQTHVARRRRIYESNYRDLRHKVFAHSQITEESKVNTLFARTRIRELQQLLTFLSSLHEALWHMLHNGRKPTLRPVRYSVKRMLKLSSPRKGGGGVQERLSHEIVVFFKSLVG